MLLLLLLVLVMILMVVVVVVCVGCCVIAGRRCRQLALMVCGRVGVAVGVADWRVEGRIVAVIVVATAVVVVVVVVVRVEIVGVALSGEVSG